MSVAISTTGWPTALVSRTSTIRFMVGILTWSIMGSMLWSRKLESLNRIEISKAAIWENFDFYRKQFEGEIWPVLKANAYGHGLKEITTILKDRKITYLVADSYYEALKMWKINPNQHVLLIGSTHPSNFDKMNFGKMALMVQDGETIDCLGKLGKKVKMHLKIDTGMGRQGIENNKLQITIDQIKKYKNIEVEGIMSHLADADNEDDSFTNIQIKRFGEVKQVVLESGVMPKYWHLAASAGIKKVPSGLTNAARLGIGLYLGKKPALRMVSTLVKVGEIEKGEQVSYGGIFVAPKKMKMGVVPLGYFEGLDRRLSNKGFLKIKDKYVPILGRVCMNMVVVGLDKISKEQACLFLTTVEAISDNKQNKNSIENIAKICETIPYDILVGLDGSIRRLVV